MHILRHETEICLKVKVYVIKLILDISGIERKENTKIT